jgi:lysophospholipase L1-like esterase
MKYSISLFLFIALALVSFCSLAQTQPPFENEIQAFEAADKKTPPPASPILFTGSSSIRLWPDIQSSFPGKPVLNRGFGGSQLSDVRRYADRIIIPYKPKQIVLYAGENDLASGNVTAQQTYDRFVDLFQYVRNQLPNVPFLFISIKQSPSRRKYYPAVDEANQLIKDYLTKQKNAQFVDIRPVMLQPNGQSRPELFKADSLHMTPAGYQEWTPLITPYLK